MNPRDAMIHLIFPSFSSKVMQLKIRPKTLYHSCRIRLIFEITFSKGFLTESYERNLEEMGLIVFE